MPRPSPIRTASNASSNSSSTSASPQGPPIAANNNNNSSAPEASSSSSPSRTPPRPPQLLSPTSSNPNLASQPHVPVTPSRLWQSHQPGSSPEDGFGGTSRSRRSNRSSSRSSWGHEDSGGDVDDRPGSGSVWRSPSESRADGGNDHSPPSTYHTPFHGGNTRTVALDFEDDGVHPGNAHGGGGGGDHDTTSPLVRSADDEARAGHMPRTFPRTDGNADGEDGDNGDNDGNVFIDEPSGQALTERTRLLEHYHRKPGCGPADDCDHGTFSPRGPKSASIRSRDSRWGWFKNGLGRRGNGDGDSDAASDSGHRGLTGYESDSAPEENGSGAGGGARGNGGRRPNVGARKRTGMSTTAWLAETHGMKGRKRMFLSYYFPFLTWTREYRLSWLKGDLIAAVTMASFYIPMALSYASNLGHLPPINGLYAFVFNPLIYAFLGTSAQMVVGPEAAGSLLLGNVVRLCVDKGHSAEGDDVMNARIAGVVTGIAGGIILVAGLTRLGFLDSVLSRPFLRGFISAIGFVILVDQLSPEMGLSKLRQETGHDHGSSVDKIVFVAKNLGQAHALTCWVSFGSFAIIMFFREAKKRMQPKYPSVAYIPDRFLVVVLSAVFTYAFGWDKKGLDILGEIKSSTGSPFTFHWPLIPDHMKHIREAMSTSFLIALLGFFESSVAAKALSGSSRRPQDGIQGLNLSANRELVALGVANIVGGCFMSLPAFGGYGRSKVNASTGGKTPLSSIFLSLITIICILFLLPYFYYLPRGVLSAMVSVVAYSLIEECPHDIKFFLRVRGWSELALMSLIFLATVFYSLPLGIALGIGLSLLSVVRHATKPRIQILGKVPGTTDRFENAESFDSIGADNHLEFARGCLIVKIPEPLTFANTGELKSRLRRLELYGATAAHPALPRLRPVENNENVVFDVHGVTGLDGSGAQVLAEIIDEYVARGTRVFFCRAPKPGSPVFERFRSSGIVERVGGMSHFLPGVEDALKLVEDGRGLGLGMRDGDGDGDGAERYRDQA